MNTNQKKNKVEKLTIPYPPKEVFAGATPQEVIMEQRGMTHLLDHFEYPAEGGILVHIVDAKFPKKGFPYPEAIWAINIAKSSLIETLKVLSQKEFLILGLLIFVPRKRRIKLIEKAIRAYYKIIGTVLAPHQLLPKFESPFAQEIGAITFDFLHRYGIGEQESGMVANIIRAIFEYDDAYRYRMQDIFSESTKEKFSNPRKEVIRLLGIMSSRENDALQPHKINKFNHSISLLLRFPRIKKAFRDAMLASVFKKLQFDEADRYWCSMRNDYDFFGTKYEDRGVTPLMGYQLGK